MERHQFWTRYSPGFGALKQSKREKEYVKLESERPDLLRRFEKERRINDQIRKKYSYRGIPWNGHWPSRFVQGFLLEIFTSL